jgi:hypothetical protein
MAFNLNNVLLPFVAYVQCKTFMTLKQLQRSSDPFTFFSAIQKAAMVSILFFTGCRPGLLGPWVCSMAISTDNVQLGQTMCSTWLVSCTPPPRRKGTSQVQCTTLTQLLNQIELSIPNPKAHGNVMQLAHWVKAFAACK